MNEVLTDQLDRELEQRYLPRRSREPRHHAHRPNSARFLPRWWRLTTPHD